MKLHVLSPDAAGKIDGTNKATLLDRLPQTHALSSADAVVVPISFFPNFAFNTALESMRKPVVVADYTEYGWEFWEKPGRRTHLFGDGRLPEYLLTNPEWAKLDAWLAANPPVLTFKRELLNTDAGPRVKPIEFLCTLPPTPLQTREQFDARPFEVLNVWGYSSPSRPKLHGNIFHLMGTSGIDVISDWSQFNSLPASTQRRWVSIYSPYWVRQPIARVMEIQRQSKISVSLPGAGAKCFRSSESPVDCIMATQWQDLAWAYPWVDGVNCIKPCPVLEELLEWSVESSLYDIYCASQENIQKYRSENYLRDYVLPNIAAAL